MMHGHIQPADYRASGQEIYEWPVQGLTRHTHINIINSVEHHGLGKEPFGLFRWDSGRLHLGPRRPRPKGTLDSTRYNLSLSFIFRVGSLKHWNFARFQVLSGGTVAYPEVQESVGIVLSGVQGPIIVRSFVCV